MLLCYLPNRQNPDEAPTLFIVPDKAEPFAWPVKVRSLKEPFPAVCRVSGEETFIVTLDEDDGQMVIAAMEPTPFYLTANLNEKPGFRVRKVKITVDDKGKDRIYFARERGGWEEWIAHSAKV